ncbi:MAG: hypothetical protein K2Q20_13680, partial [Phycisphaerales bacterium]|nr:hypothetical protein [Phycisphaerales bacterium]
MHIAYTLLVLCGVTWPGHAVASQMGFACCNLSGGCVLDTESSCSSNPGFFIPGGGSTCQPNPCAQPTPCCFPNGTCTLVNLSFGSCPGLATPVATCSPSPCIARVCCNDTTGACAVVTVPNPTCTGGTLRPGPTCQPNPCPGQPVDCVVSPWSDWSPCTRQCGGGIEVRNRVIVTPASNGGQPCPELQEARTCNTQPCEVFCCDSGICTVVQGSACPSGQTPLAPGFTCSPNPCPQPVACCDPCGACTVLPPGSSCPAGTTASAGATSCSPSPCVPGRVAAPALSGQGSVQGGFVFAVGADGFIAYATPSGNPSQAGALLEYTLNDLPPASRIRSATLRLEFLDFNGLLPSRVGFFAGDGQPAASDLAAAVDLIAVTPTPTSLVIDVDVTAPLAAAFAQGATHAGFAIRAQQSINGEAFVRTAGLSVQYERPRVCCSPFGVCSLVAPDACCPSGTSELASAFVCTPNACPQPTACCSPCGTCALMPVGVSCPDGSTAQPGATSCSPINPCPTAGVVASLPPTASGRVSDVGITPGDLFLGFGPNDVILEFDLASIPTQARLRSATLELNTEAGRENGVTGVEVRTYAGDGVLALNDRGLGSLSTSFSYPGPIVRTVDVTASVRQRLESSDRYAGFGLRADTPSSVAWTGARLLLEVVAPKVCCDAVSGVCTTVSPDQCCPSGMTLLAGALSCVPQPCPQPVACCDPCGACAVALGSCPSGSTSASTSTCTPTNLCPGAGTVLVLEAAARGSFEPDSRFPSGFGRIDGAFRASLSDAPARAFAEYDLSAIPAGARIRSASFGTSVAIGIGVPSTASILAYAGDGQITSNDFNAGTFV